MKTTELKAYKRKTHEVDIRNYDLDGCLLQTSSADIENLVLRLDDDRRFDVGALCYTDRFQLKRSAIKEVIVSTFRPERQVALKNWTSNNLGKAFSEITISTLWAVCDEITGFAKWCDLNHHTDFLLSPEQYHFAVQKYSLSLRLRNSSGSLSKFRANRLQSAAIKGGYDFFPETNFNFSSDVPIISNSGNNTKTTDVPDEQEMASHLSMCDCLFKEITPFLIEFKKFPYQLTIMSEAVQLVPAEYPFVTKKILQEQKSKTSNNLLWNYEKGCLRPINECIDRSQRAPDQVIADYIEAENLIKNSNEDSYHPRRFRLAKLAHDSFISLFAANSGLNETQIRDLLWDENYIIEDSENLGFAVIKMRANGRLIQVQIKKTFINQFKKYIELRKYICRHANNDYLFVGMHKNKCIITGQLQRNAIERFCNRVTKYIDPDFTGLGYRQLRKYKSIYLLSVNTPITVVSSIMQTSEATILASYSDGNERTAVNEITAVLNRLVSMLDDYEGEPIPPGDCHSLDNPTEDMETPDGYRPNCTKFESCIFCENFGLHADADSVRKILSMRFFINEHITTCTNIDHFKEVHGAALKRIELILNELITARPDMESTIAMIANEVEREYKLTEYWERQLQRLIRMRVLK